MLKFHRNADFRSDSILWYTQVPQFVYESPQCRDVRSCKGLICSLESDRPQYLNSFTLNTNGLAGQQARTWGSIVCSHQLISISISEVWRQQPWCSQWSLHKSSMHLGCSWIEIVWACFRCRELWNGWNTYILYPDDLFGWLKVSGCTCVHGFYSTHSLLTWVMCFCHLIILIDRFVSFWLTFIQHNQKNLLCESARSERATLIDLHLLCNYQWRLRYLQSHQFGMKENSQPTFKQR